MKRFVSMIFCLLFCFTLVACSLNEEEFAPEYDSSVSAEIDLDGRNFVYGMVQDYFFEGEDSTLGYINSTEFADLAAKRLDDVEKVPQTMLLLKTLSSIIAQKNRVCKFTQFFHKSLTKYRPNGF